jgi:hypothetical protein
MNNSFYRLRSFDESVSSSLRAEIGLETHTPSDVKI